MRFPLTPHDGAGPLRGDSGPRRDGRGLVLYGSGVGTDKRQCPPGISDPLLSVASVAWSAHERDGRAADGPFRET